MKYYALVGAASIATGVVLAAVIGLAVVEIADGRLVDY